MNYSVWLGVLSIFLISPGMTLSQEKSGENPVPSSKELPQLKAYGAHIKDPMVRHRFTSLVEAIIARQTLDCSTRVDVLPRPSTKAVIARIENALLSAAEDTAKGRILRLVARTHYFTVRQVFALVSLMKTDGPRAESILALYPRITDEKRSYTLLSLVVDAAAQTELLRGIEALKATSPRTPATTSP